MCKNYSVRFSAKSISLNPGLHVDAASQSSLASAREHRKSHNGCRECRLRRVKCDESFPICKRCQGRGSTCTLTAKSSGWRLEKPWLLSQLITLPTNCSTATDKKLLQWWFDTASNILVLDPHSNPLSLPILEHLAISPALCFAVQSLSAGHKSYFDEKSQLEFLKKRSVALNLCRKELSSTLIPLTTVFFTVLLLGISTSWMYKTLDNYGKEHLIGARAILDILLAKQEFRHDPKLRTILAYYMWWDMSCAFLVDSQELPPLNLLPILSTIDDSQALDLGFTGSMIEIHYLLGLLLRYCREVFQIGSRDYTYEKWLEQRLLRWQPSRVLDEELLLAEAFQKHGLITLYRVCGVRSHCDEQDPWRDEDLTTQIHQYAIDIVSKVTPDQVRLPYMTTLIIPLLTGGAELTVHDQELRNRVQQALSSIYASARTSPVLWEKDWLEELWTLQDSGVKVFHLNLMHRKRWLVTLV